MLILDEVRDQSRLVGAIRSQSETKFGAGRTRHFVASEAGIDVGLLIVEAFPRHGCLAVCKIFVPVEHRSRGIGRQLMREAENLARLEGLPRVQVHPRPLDHTTTVEKLESWYESLGYFQVSADTLEKIVQP